MFMLILTNFWHMHLYWLYPGGYISLLHTLQSQNWQVRESGCYCLILHLDRILFVLCCAATWSTGQQKGVLPPSSHGPRADLVQMPSICLSHQQSRRGGCIPKCPEVGRTAALSRELHAERKYVVRRAPVPKIGPQRHLL